MSNVRGSHFVRYSIAVLSGGLAICIRLLLDPIVGYQNPFTLAMLAVLVTAWFGGFGPALLSVVIGVLAAKYFFMPSRGSLWAPGLDQQFGVAIHIVAGVGISLLGASMHSALRKAKEAAATAGRLGLADRQEKEDTLRAQREWFANVFSTVPVVICSFRLRPDGSTSFPLASPAIERIYGLTPEELARDASPIHERLHPDDAPAFRASIQESARDMTPWSIEYRVLHPQRGEVWVEGHAFPIREVDGAILWQGYIADITERKRTDEALRDRERLLGIVTGSARVGLVVVGAGYRYLFANEAYAEVLGLHTTDIVGRRVPDLVAAGWPQIQPRLDRAFAGERMTYELTLPKTQQSSEARLLSVVYEPRSDGGGQPTVVVVVVDITERKRAEEALRESEGRLRLAQQAARIGTFERNLQTNVTLWTPELEALYGIEPGGFPTSADGWEKLLHPEDRAHAAQCVKQAIESGLPTEGEWRVVWPDGSIRWISGRFQVFQDGADRPRRLVGVHMDMTDRRRAEATLHLQQMRLEGIVNSAMDGIVTIDEGQKIVLINAAAERMFGCKSADVLGQSVDRFIPVRYRMGHERHVEQFGKTGVAARAMGTFGRISGLRADGEEFPIEASISQLRVEGHRLFTVTCRDVTERVRALEATRLLEAQLRQAQKMEAFGQLAGGVAHDFNNMLTVISMYSQILTNMIPENPAARNAIGGIREAGDRAASLTRQLLAFSRQQVLDPKVLDLNLVISDTERMLRRLIGEDVVFATSLVPSISPVKVDPGQIEQVIMNLAVNARDAMPRGGKLTIETKEIELDESYTNTHVEVKPGRFVMMAVSDTGDGIPSEIRSRIFEPFFTTKEVGKGTGLGLAVVHGIVKQSGGSIDVYSELGVGTTFKIYLPAAEVPARRETEPSAPSAERGHETILLVEDEDAVRVVVTEALRRFGYTVLPAAGGAACLELMERHRGEVALLVTDVVMPGMSGRELAETLTAKWPGLKVLFLSGYTSDAVVRHGVLQSEASFLQKPFTPNTLAKKVREVLDRGR